MYATGRIPFSPSIAFLDASHVNINGKLTSGDTNTGSLDNTSFNCSNDFSCTTVHTNFHH